MTEKQEDRKREKDYYKYMMRGGDDENLRGSYRFFVWWLILCIASRYFLALINSVKNVNWENEIFFKILLI